MLPPRFKTYVSQKGTPYYYDTVTKTSSWKQPLLSSTSPLPASSSTPLPEGWTRHWNSPYKRYFYRNSALNKSTWDLPVSSSPPGNLTKDPLDSPPSAVLDIVWHHFILDEKDIYINMLSGETIVSPPVNHWIAKFLPASLSWEFSRQGSRSTNKDPRMPSTSTTPNKAQRSTEESHLARQLEPINEQLAQHASPPRSLPSSSQPPTSRSPASRASTSDTNSVRPSRSQNSSALCQSRLSDPDSASPVYRPPARKPPSTLPPPTRAAPRQTRRADQGPRFLDRAKLDAYKPGTPLPPTHERMYEVQDTGKLVGESTLVERVAQRTLSRDTSVSLFVYPYAQGMPAAPISSLFPRPGTEFKVAPLIQSKHALWVFLDHADRECGPYTSAEMRLGFDNGRFAPSTRVKRLGDTNFATLKSMVLALPQPDSQVFPKEGFVPNYLKVAPVDDGLACACCLFINPRPIEGQEAHCIICGHDLRDDKAPRTSGVARQTEETAGSLGIGLTR